MPTPVTVDLLIEFDLRDFFPKNIYPPTTNLGAGQITLPDNGALWIEFKPQLVEAPDYYELVRVAGNMYPEWMNGWYADEPDGFYLSYYFSPNVYDFRGGVDNDTKFGPEDVSYVGVVVPPELVSSLGSFNPTQSMGGDGYWSVHGRMDFGTASANAMEQVRIFITATKGSQGPEPEPEPEPVYFWMNLVNAKEII